MSHFIRINRRIIYLRNLYLAVCLYRDISVASFHPLLPMLRNLQVFRRIRFLWKNILFGQSFLLIYHNLLLRGLGTRCQIDSAGKNTDGGNHLLSYTIPHHMLPPPLTRSITLLPYSLMLLWLVKIYRHISAVDGIQYNYIRA